MKRLMLWKFLLSAILTASLICCAFFLVTCTEADLEMEDASDPLVFSGTILVQEMDRTFDKPSGSQTQYLLVDEEEKSMILEFDVKPDLITGDIVKVTALSQDGQTITVDSIEVLTRTPRRLDGPLVRTPKQHRVAILAMQESTITEQQALDAVNGTVDSVNRFYAESSGNIDTFKADVFKRYDLGDTTSYCNGESDPRGAMFTAFKNDGYNISDYDHIVVVTPNSCGNWYAFAMVGSIRDDGRTAFLKGSVFKDAAFNATNLCHELGHNLGLRHSRSMNCGTVFYKPNGDGCTFDEYGNYNDRMGLGDLVYFSTPYQRFLGWTGAQNVVTAGKSGIFNLQPADGAMCGVRAVRIPIPQETGRYFYVEYRRARPDSPYAGTGPVGQPRQNAVLVTRSGDGLGGDSSSPTDRVELGTTKYQGASLGIRYDLGAGVAVKVLSMDGPFAQVAIEMPGSAVHHDENGNEVFIESDGSNGPKSCGSKDACPSDPDKTEPGVCGCGVPDSDSDNDTTADCIDDCPSDENKIQPGVCGCGNSDADIDNDGTADCNDKCPGDAGKTEPGICGCGVTEGTCGPLGTGLRGFYFNNPDFTDQIFERVDQIINFNWSYGSPDPQIERDTFSVRWTGLVKADFSETYAFYTVSDDGIRLWVDDELIVDNWTIHAPTENSGTIALEAGKSYEIKIEYFENGGGAVAKLLWSSASQPKQIIPEDNLSTDLDEDLCPDDPNKKEPGVCGCGVPDSDSDNDGKSDCIDDCPSDENKIEPGVCGCGNSDADSDNDGTADCNDNCPGDPEKTEPGICGCGVTEGTCGPLGTGLRGYYFNNADFTDQIFERVDQTINFNWSYGSPDPQIERDTFSVRWTGFVKTDFSETYTFYTVSDDGIRLWVDDELIIDNWTIHAPTENSGTIVLEAGKSYEIKIEYFENGGGAVAKLLWSSASQIKQIIPEERLFANLDRGETRQCVQVNEHQSAELSCPSGEIIVSIDFASYGLPTGSCDTYFAEGSCHADSSETKVEDLCLNRQSCTVGAKNTIFGDPCVGTFKRLAVVYNCSNSGEGSRIPRITESQESASEGMTCNTFPRGSRQKGSWIVKLAQLLF